MPVFDGMHPGEHDCDRLGFVGKLTGSAAAIPPPRGTPVCMFADATPRALSTGRIEFAKVSVGRLCGPAGD
jgi:hypothetical protein